MVNIKTEAGIASPPSPPPPTQSLPYFKPGQEVEFQPILGHSNCRICKSYFPDEDHRRNQHRAQHPDRLFLVNLPVDTFYYNMEIGGGHQLNGQVWDTKDSWPTMMVINRLYNMSSGKMAHKQKDKAGMDR
jgi:hypothetical protein